MQLAFTLINDINPFWDTNISDLINGIKDSLPNQQLAGVAKEVAAVFSLIYLSIKAYAMIIGEGKFEIMPLFRPFLITLVIVNFGLFSEIAGYPASASGEIGKASFEANAKIMDQDMDTKDKLTSELFQTLISNTTTIKNYYTQSSTADQTIGDEIISVMTFGGKEALSELNAYITVYEQLLWIKLSLWLQGFVTWMVIGIFKGICYCLFFLQLILLYILGCLGPLSFAFSIAGPFKDSWVQWTARYIAVSFYNTIGYIILNIACAIMNYGLNQEISRLSQLLAKKDVITEFIASVQHVDNFVGYLFIAIITAIAGILATPIVSTWIIGTVGAGTAFFGSYVSTVKMAGSAGASAAGNVASTPGQMAKLL